MNINQPYSDLKSIQEMGGGHQIELSDNFGSSYDQQEFLDLRKDYQGSEFTINQKPELLKYKKILESIRNTGRTNYFLLEHEGSQGFVVQISDICLKFKNLHSTTDLVQEVKSYKIIEEIYSKFKEEYSISNFSIPGLQRHLCTEDYITMEYAQGLTLSLDFYLKENNITLEEIYSFLTKNFDKYEDLKYLYQKAALYGYNNLKEYDLRTILHYMNDKSEKQLEEIMHLDLKDILISISGDQSLYKTYRNRKKYLRQNNILFIDDHNDNLKYYNGTLSAFDFGNMTQRTIIR